LITIDQLVAVPLFKRHFDQATKLYPAAAERRKINETIRRMINTLVGDLIQTTAQALAELGPQSLADIRAADPLVAHSESIRIESLALKRFLRDNLYQHFKVQRMSTKGRRVVADLFTAFMGDPRLLPPQYQAKADIDRARAVADYISGMTDRYAMREHRRLFAIEDI
jgi:dGTPase